MVLIIMFNFFIALLTGFLAGIVAGLLPGMHPNFVGIFFLGTFLDQFSFVSVIVMLVSAQFFEVLRSVFFFVPEESNVLAMHPLFKFIKEGKGLIVLKLSVIGLVTALLIGIITSPILLWAIPPIFMFVKDV